MAFPELIKQIKEEQGLDHEVPGFDPKNGNEAGRYLFLLEAPGPRALQTGYVSVDNPDPTAWNFQAQLGEAEIEAKDIAVWNVVPWYLGDKDRKKIRGATAMDVRSGLKYVEALVALMPQLECIVLVGGAARKAHVFLSQATTARILSCHHPSAQSLNANPFAAEENVAVLRFMKQTTVGARGRGYTRSPTESIA